MKPTIEIPREWKIDPIGTFWGENISEMSRERLLEVIKFMSGQMEYLRKIEEETQDYRIDKEVRTKLTH